MCIKNYTILKLSLRIFALFADLQTFSSIKLPENRAKVRGCVWPFLENKIATKLQYIIPPVGPENRQN